MLCGASVPGTLCGVVAVAMLLVTAGATALALFRGQRLAPWFLAIGVPLCGGLWLLGVLRVPWPDLGVWTKYPLNPYLLVTLSFILVAAGLIGTAVRVIRAVTRPAT